MTINYYWNRASAASRIQLRMERRKKKFWGSDSEEGGCGTAGRPWYVCGCAGAGGGSLVNEEGEAQTLAAELPKQMWQTWRIQLRLESTNLLVAGRGARFSHELSDAPPRATHGEKRRRHDGCFVADRC